MVRGLSPLARPTKAMAARELVGHHRSLPRGRYCASVSHRKIGATLERGPLHELSGRQTPRLV